MKAIKVCGSCGSPIPEAAAEGLCTRCLIGNVVNESARQDGKPRPTIDLELPSVPGEEAAGGRIGPYRLLERLGAGGFGEVWAAEQKEPVRRRVALKIIKLGMDTKQVVARFEAERQALAMMDHPNIARVLDAGATEVGRPYFVMELVKGVPITAYCDQARLDTKGRLGLFIKICRAIQHAHQKGIIHRDIKPSNILVTMHDGAPVPKVIDFGIAKATQQELTEQTVYTLHGQFIGTPVYMSPEQAEMSGLDVDTRADIYSLGVLLYELLVGATPFDAKELASSGFDGMRQTIREKAPARPSTRLTALAADELTTTAGRRSAEASKLVHQIKGDLDWIVMKCLEKDRNRRYETANGIAADVQRHLDCQPVVARPPSRLYEFQKTVRRHKVGFGATAAVIVALAIGLGVSAWQTAAATRARDQLRVQMDATHKAKQDADKAAQAEIQQRQRAEGLLRESQAAEADLIFARGLEVAERGDVDYGMMWMLEALKRTPAGRAGFEDVVRRNLSGWSQLVPRLLQTWKAGMHAFSADGAVVAIQLGDTLRFLDARSGVDVAPSFDTRDRIYEGLVFHPAKPQVALAYRPLKGDPGTAPSSVTLVDTRTGRPVFSPVPFPDGVWQLLFSPDGSELFVIGRNGREIAVCDAATGRQRKAVREPTVPARVFVVSPDGRRLIADDFSVVVDALTLETMTNKLLEPDISHHLLRPDGAELVIHHPPGTEVELRLPPGCDVANPVVKLVKWLFVESLAADGSLFTVGEMGQRALFDLETLRPAWSPVRDPFGALGLDPTMQIAPADSGRWQIPRPLSRPAAPVRQSNRADARVSWHRSGSQPVQFSAAGDLFVHRDDISDDRPMTAARLRDAQTGFPLARPFRQRGSAMWDVALSRDGRWAATTTYTSLRDWHLFAGETTIWDARTGSRRHGPLAPNLMMRALEFSPDGKLLVASTVGSIRFWNTETGKPEGKSIATPGNAVALVFSPDGQTLAAGLDGTQGAPGLACLYDVRTREPLGPAFPVGSDKNWCVFLAFTPDGQNILTAGWTTGIFVNDIHTLQPRYPAIKVANTVQYIEMSADGTRFAFSETGSGMIRVFDLLTGKQVGRGMQHSADSQAIALNADGTLLACGSVEGTVRLWQVATGQPLGPPLSHRYAIWDVRFAPDGRSFSSTDRRGITKHWPVPSPALGEPAALQAQLELWVRSRLAEGAPVQISAEEWQQRKAAVDGFPSGSVWFSDPIPDLAWHEARASDAEGDANWYGAWWHLDRLVAARPTDWQFRARRGRVLVLRGQWAAADADFAKAAELNGEKSLLDWMAHCAYTCREDKAWKSALYFLKRLVAAEPDEWQWRADQEEAFENLGRKDEAQAAFVKGLELCRQPIIPSLAADLVQKSEWAALRRELSRGEKTGWLSLEDWKLWARSARELQDEAALAAIVARFKERAGPDCPLAKQLAP